MQAIETLTYTHLVIPIKTIVKTKRNGLSIFVLVNFHVFNYIVNFAIFLEEVVVANHFRYHQFVTTNTKQLIIYCKFYHAFILIENIFINYILNT